MNMNSNHTDQINQNDQADQEKIAPADKKPKNLVTRISEAIRFQEWVDKIDQKDKKLDPAKRKQKWVIILGGLFFLYLLSFLIPPPELSHQPLQPQKGTEKKDAESSPATETQKPLTFEMPVDSFETILKKNIHESIPEKK